MSVATETEPYPSFTPEELLRQLDESEDWFHIVSGEVETAGQTTVIGVSSYHAPIRELVTPISHKHHLDVSRGFVDRDSGQTAWGIPSPDTEVTLTYGYNRLRHDALSGGNSDFRLLRGALQINETEVPVRIVRINLDRRVSAFWLMKDDTPEL